MLGIRFSPVPILHLAAGGVTALLLSLLAIEFTRLDGALSLLWFANGPLLATLNGSPRRNWLAHCAAWAVGMMIAMSIASPVAKIAPLLMLVNVLEVSVATLVIARLGIAGDPLESGRSVALFVAAIVVGTMFGSVGAGAVTAATVGLGFTAVATNWFTAHSLGLLIAAPLSLMLVRRGYRVPSFAGPRSALVALAVAAALVGTTVVVFGRSDLPLLFLPILPLLIATIAYQRLGAAAGVVVITLVGGMMTLGGMGPLMPIEGGEGVRLQFFHFYLAVLFLVALPVAAVLAQRDRLLRQLGEREAFYRVLTDHASDVILTMDVDSTIRFVSPAVRELGYFDPAMLVGKKASAWIYPDDLPQVTQAHHAAIADPDRTFSSEYRALKADGTVSWLENNARGIRDEHGDVSSVVCIIRDLNARKLRESELLRAATTDPLTGLLNRAAFRRSAVEILAQARRGIPSTLALIDLDHFKRINDEHGHGTGDATLLMLADLLRENMRGEDVAARIGGEEFALLFRGSGLQSAERSCERLRDLLASRWVKAGDARVRVTMSIGIVEFCPAMTLDQLMGAADAALYRAKERGRNRIQVASDPLLA